MEIRGASVGGLRGRPTNSWQPVGLKPGQAIISIERRTKTLLLAAPCSPINIIGSILALPGFAVR